jgi:hypothetical protein
MDDTHVEACVLYAPSIGDCLDLAALNLPEHTLHFTQPLHSASGANKKNSRMGETHARVIEPVEV